VVVSVKAREKATDFNHLSVLPQIIMCLFTAPIIILSPPSDANLAFYTKLELAVRAAGPTSESRRLNSHTSPLITFCACSFSSDCCCCCCCDIMVTVYTNGVEEKEKKEKEECA
jgi:hypothetical protein